MKKGAGLKKELITQLSKDRKVKGEFLKIAIVHFSREKKVMLKKLFLRGFL